MAGAIAAQLLSGALVGIAVGMSNITCNYVEPSSASVILKVVVLCDTFIILCARAVPW